MIAIAAFYLTTFVTPSVQEEIRTYLSFNIDNKEVVWSQIYHQDSATAAELSVTVFNHLKRKAWIRNIQYEGEDIIADLYLYKIDYKRYGGKFMKTSTIVRTGRWDGKVRVNFKDGKYRIIVYGLHYVARQPATGSGKVTIEPHQISGTWTEFVLNDYRTAFRKSRFSNMDLMHYNLKESFTLTKDQLIDSDW